MAADLPLAVDHFRHFAGCIRAQEGSIGEVDHETFAYHRRLLRALTGFAFDLPQYGCIADASPPSRVGCADVRGPSMDS